MGSSRPNRKVVITGLGVLTSLGHDVETFWANLIKGECGIERISRFDVTDYPCQVGAEVRDFDPTSVMDAKDVRRNDRFTHFAMAATKSALRNGSIDVSKLDSFRIGVLLGSGIGGMETIENQSARLRHMGPRKVSPFTIPSLIANMASGVVAIEIGARGANFGIVSACATASHSIGESLRMIQTGDADIMVAGGSEAAITPLSYAGFCNMKAMTASRNNDPHRASRPFDKTRDGFVMGEGAGVVILESLEHAEKRGARIFCEVAGYSATCDAFHITAPDPTGQGLSRSITNALDNANVQPEAIQYINAHGTSTTYNDRTETNAVKEVFGDHARNILMSSTKSMTGHLLGAAGGIEAASCAMVIEKGEVPPTINYEVPDPECDLNYVPNKKIRAKVDVAMSINLGFGGHNATLVFKRV